MGTQRPRALALRCVIFYVFSKLLLTYKGKNKISYRRTQPWRHEYIFTVVPRDFCHVNPARFIILRVIIS